MRTIKTLFAFLLPIAALLIAGFCHPAPASGRSGHGFAVLELFTSEGCSSCPPADEAVGRISASYKGDVYVLCYHVDYWDQLGWKDAFSNASYSQRQREYARVLSLSGVYTPQAIINGKEELVGSDDAKLKTGIKEELEYSSNAYDNQLTLTAESKDGKTIAASGQVRNATEDAFCFVLVQLRADSKVLKGENQGRHLRHVNIVRDFQVASVGQNKEGSVTFTLPEGLTAKDCKVIAFLQSRLNMQISAAGETAIK